MFSKIAPVALLSAAAFAAPTPGPVVEERDLVQAAFCLVENIALTALQQNTQATAFCSSFLKIQPVTSTVLVKATQTITALATSTVTSTTTGAQSTSICQPKYANSNANNKRGLFGTAAGTTTVAVTIPAVSAATVAVTIPAVSATTVVAVTIPAVSATTVKIALATPTCLAGLSSSIISADCACLNIPTSTVTSTSTSTKAVTVTATTVTTAVVTATPTAVASQLYDLNGTYTASNGDLFQLYPNLDFPQGDGYSGSCGVAGDSFTTPDGTFSCLSWDDCMDICATASWGCVGASYVPSWNQCYLKNKVPGNGLPAPQCGTVQSEIVQSGLNIAQGNTYAV